MLSLQELDRVPLSLSGILVQLPVYSILNIFQKINTAEEIQYR
jgi:hypothetical protein